MLKLLLKKLFSHIPLSIINKIYTNKILFSHYKIIHEIETVYDRTVYLNKIAAKLNKLSNVVVLEFGVYKGDTLKLFSEKITDPDAKFYGFDTFTGLPENWLDLKKGHFSSNGKLPDINDQRISYEVGLFKDTLPTFLKKLEKESLTMIL